MPPARSPPELPQAVIRYESYSRRWRKPCLNRVVQVRGGENNQVPVPNRRKPEFCGRVNAQGHVALSILDCFCPALLQRQERVLHGIAVVAPWRINCVHCEYIKLDDFTHGGQPKPGARPPTPKPL